MSDNNITKKPKSGVGIHTRRVIAYIVLIFLSFLCLFGFYILFINATRSNGELARGFQLYPGAYLAKNFRGMLNSSQPIVRGMVNSLFVATLSAILSTYFSTMTAYAIHAYRFKLRNAAFTFILAIMMIPTQVTALGFINLLTRLNLMDNYIPLIVPAIASPAVFFYMKQYMDSTLPISLIEAARIDGAGEFRIFNTIAMPMMRPAIAVQAIFAFVSSWNNYFTPALVLKDENMKTLPILIAELRGADFMKFDMGIVYMTIAFSIFPVIIIYLILSKNIVGGIAAGAVKG